jgi:hypothetical protein
MLTKPVVANLHNTKTGRYHPILFDERLLLHGGKPKHTQYNSIRHHTVGFDTRQEAIAECLKMSEQFAGRLCIEKDFPWDGEAVPAMVVLFVEVDGVLQPLFISAAMECLFDQLVRFGGAIVREIDAPVDAATKAKSSGHFSVDGEGESFVWIPRL